MNIYFQMVKRWRNSIRELCYYQQEHWWTFHSVEAPISFVKSLGGRRKDDDVYLVYLHNVGEKVKELCSSVNNKLVLERSLAS